MHALEAAAFAAEDSAQDFAGALLAGLHAQPKRVPCKFLYDAQGSALFERICELPEYYPTRTEMALLKAHAAEFARYMGPDVELVEFGAGSGRKASMLLDVLEEPRLYMPIDISPDSVAAAAGTVWHAFPHMKVIPLEADYTAPLDLGPQRGRRRVGFFPGSTIGNFPPDEALAFLRRLAALLRGGGLLIGVDLVKDPAVLHAAYNDAAGVTAAFNRNLLARANRELEADFLLDRFAHYAFYQPVARRVEMHLVSLVQQQVHVCGQAVAFAAGETLHTEDSYKYSVIGFHSLAAQAGFLPRATRVDPEHRFSLHWLEVPE